MADETKHPVTLTPKAVEMVKQIRAEDPEVEKDAALRLGIQGGGCSGYQYHISFSKPSAFDETFEIDGLTVVIDPASMQFLEGCTVDWQDGLRSGFKFINPHATRSCGCGESFTTD